MEIFDAVHNMSSRSVDKRLRREVSKNEFLQGARHRGGQTLLHSRLLLGIREICMISLRDKIRSERTARDRDHGL